MPDTLLPADQREVSIRAEAEQRSGIVCKIMLHILHPGFLVGPEECTDRITECNSLLLQEFQRIHTDNGRSFVINDTAAEDISFSVTHGKRVSFPTRAGRDNVHMGDGCKVSIPFPADKGITDFVFTVACAEAEFC